MADGGSTSDHGVFMPRVLVVVAVPRRRFRRRFFLCRAQAPCSDCVSRVRIRIGFGHATTKVAWFGFGSVSPGRVRIRIGFCTTTVSRNRVRFSFATACGFDCFLVRPVSAHGAQLAPRAASRADILSRTKVAYSATTTSRPRIRTANMRR